MICPSSNPKFHCLQQKLGCKSSVWNTRKWLVTLNRFLPVFLSTAHSPLWGLVGFHQQDRTWRYNNQSRLKCISIKGENHKASSSLGLWFRTVTLNKCLWMFNADRRADTFQRGTWLRVGHHPGRRGWNSLSYTNTTLIRGRKWVSGSGKAWEGSGGRGEVGWGGGYQWPNFSQIEARWFCKGGRRRKTCGDASSLHRWVPLTAWQGEAGGMA